MTNQKAIKILNGLEQSLDAMLNDEGKTAFCMAITALELFGDSEQLLSAQNIIRCKDCDWWTKQEDSLQGRCDRYGTYPTGYWYCAAARERREK